MRFHDWQLILSDFWLKYFLTEVSDPAGMLQTKNPRTGWCPSTKTSFPSLSFSVPLGMPPLSPFHITVHTVRLGSTNKLRVVEAIEATNSLGMT